MKNIGRYLVDKYGSWGWMGQRAHDAAAINKVLPLDFIISCDRGREASHYFKEENIFSVEKKRGIRKDWSNEDLKTELSGEFGEEIYKRWSKKKKDINLLCYRSVERLEQKAGEKNSKLNIFSAYENMKTYFDNKVRLYSNLEELSMPRIPGKISCPGKHSFSELVEELGMPFVVQFPYGSSGKFTFIVRGKEEYDYLLEKYSQDEAVIRKYIDGVSLNVNAVIVSGEKGVRILSLFPSVQIIGVPECSNFSSAFCGNDYVQSGQLDEDILQQVRRCVKITGKWMFLGGYRGIFGMDFLVEGNTVYPVEINPRFQNSTAFHNGLDVASGRAEKSLFLLHIAEFCRGKDRVMKEYLDGISEEDISASVQGAQLIIHNKDKTKIVTGELMPGIYRSEDAGIRYIKGGSVITDCENEGDILITCGVPAKNMCIAPNAPICKVQVRDGILRSGKRSDLTDRMKKIVEYVYDRLRLEDVSDSAGSEPLMSGTPAHN